MKIMILAHPGSIHTVKWVNALSKKGIEIFLVGVTNYNSSNYSSLNKFHIFSLNLDIELYNDKEGSIGKIIYLKLLTKLKRLIKEFSPDILHAHYASSYGLIGALVNFHPFVISVWGSDVFDFPRKSFLSKKILQYNLRSADKILSTSRIMAEELKNYTDREIAVTPFGVDIEKFKLFKMEKNNSITIGTVKALEEVYGIEYLIKSFNILKEKYPGKDLKLIIAGEGSQEVKLKNLCKRLKVENQVEFIGKISQEEVVQTYNKMDVAVFLSKEESFGVSVVEAMACEKPIVVSDVGGLPEVVENNVTGFVVEKENPEAAALAVEKLILNKELREKFGRNGRERVMKLFNWNDNVDQMINIYKQII